MNDELEQACETLSQMVARQFLCTPRPKVIMTTAIVQRKRGEFLSAVSKGFLPPDSSPRTQPVRRDSDETDDETALYASDNGIIRYEDREDEVSDPVHGDVRLSNGQSSNEGRLEVYLDGSWGTVCDKNFDDGLADLVCRQLGYNGNGEVIEGGSFGPGSGKHLRNIKCNVTHAGKLADCQSQSGITKRCTHNSDVGVRCHGVIATDTEKEDAKNEENYDDVSIPVHGDVRLVKNGTTSYEGRLEIFLENSWGTVCDKNFDDRLADLVCRQLGYNGTGEALEGGRFGPGSGKHLRNIKCNVTHVGKLTDCQSQSGITKRCTHNTDVGVRCHGDVVDEKPDQQSTSDNNGEKTDNITNTQPQNGEVRLIDGDRVSEGRLEVFLYGRWGTVCDKNFDKSLGELVCRQLGFTEVANVLPGSTFGVETSKPMHMRNIRCSENATAIGECEYQRGLTHRCSHNTDVGVVCRQAITTEVANQTAEGDVRLTSPENEVGSGRLEVFINDQWGTVCDVKFNIEHGNLVCRQLNFESAVAIETDSFFGKGTGMPMHMRNLKCNATAQRIFDCGYNRGFTNRCTHDTDVGIRCQK
ncbi:deleted in malignant brain tumors 1 protein-like [Anneissia japonica]|uniref:deleted in malignant brain tumors 1 protein-like n=1 Tax=Anneissia japonica TaxID=1529436 RepID=UPI001425BA29|nr:deleted in malignant brain tumors 1 protein-like [Anneissia japonica]